MSEPTTIPDAVVDQQAYMQYIEMKNSPAMQLDNRLIYCSDNETVLDPRGHWYANKDRVNHLPEDERKKIKAKFDAQQILLQRLKGLHRRAFGIKKQSHHDTLIVGILDDRKSEIVEYFARGLKEKEVLDILNKHWRYEISMINLKLFKNKYQELIDQRTLQYRKDFSDLPLTHKRGRLEEYHTLYSDYKNKYKVKPSRDNLKVLQSLLKDIKDEVEVQKLQIDATIEGKIEHVINFRTQEIAMNGLVINDIIIARVAARMGINPRFLITRLHNSFYAKNAAFLQPDYDDIMQQEVVYPSTIVYNWDQINKVHEESKDTNVEDAEWEEVTETEQQTATDLKKALLEKIANKKHANKAAIKRVHDQTPSADSESE